MAPMSAIDELEWCAATVSGAALALHRECYGLSSTSTQVIVRRDYLMVVCRNGYGPYRAALVAEQHEGVMRARSAFREALRDRLTGTVEAIMGRKVIAFSPQTDFDPYLSIELFFLDPLPGDEHARRITPAVPSMLVEGRVA